MYLSTPGDEANHDFSFSLAANTAHRRSGNIRVQNFSRIEAWGRANHVAHTSTSTTQHQARPDQASYRDSEKMERETFRKESMVRGYHVYGELWSPELGEELQCQRERGNLTDCYAVAVKKEDEVVGHLPRKISRLCTLFIRRGGTISCVITGRRRHSHDLAQGGLEVPCNLCFEGDAKEIKKLVKLFAVCKS